MEDSGQLDRVDAAENGSADGAWRAPLHLHCATVWVRDLQRSRRFFVEKLGFQVAADLDSFAGLRRIIVTPPSGQPGIALVAPPEASPEFQRIGHDTGLSFLAGDLRAVFAEWSKRGVRVTLSPVRPPPGRTERCAIFEDVDGNRFQLVETDEATRALENERLASVALLGAERLERHLDHMEAASDLAIAKAVQSRLFPQQQPPLQTLAYAGVCYPARTVGGDYYDFLPLGDGRLALIVGDIAGKGIAAALLMANLQAGLRSQSATAWDQPREFLQSVNRLFFRNTNLKDYATVFFAAYDDQTRLLRYANCGHPPAFLLRAGDTLEQLASTATVMGLFERWDCTVEERRLHPGDTLLLYTDGVTEALSPAGEEFGEERLLECLRRHRELPPERLLDVIIDEVRRFSPHEQGDDITVIAARCG